MTLVELIVTFAVAAIFMAAAAMLVVPATKLTIQVKGMNRVHDDAAIIMETVVNELSYAESYIDSNNNPIGIWLTEENVDPTSTFNGYYRKVTYNNKSGYPVCMSVTEADNSDVGGGRLLIVYEEIADAGGSSVQEKIDWWYGSNLYRDNVIELGFKKKYQDKNIITVCLTVTNTTSGYSYTQKTDVRCVNVTESGIVEGESADP